MFVRVCDAKDGRTWFVESYDPQAADSNVDFGYKIVVLTPVNAAVESLECGNKVAARVTQESLALAI